MVVVLKKDNVNNSECGATGSISVLGTEVIGSSPIIQIFLRRLKG